MPITTTAAIIFASQAISASLIANSYKTYISKPILDLFKSETELEKELRILTLAACEQFQIKFSDLIHIEEGKYQFYESGQVVEGMLKFRLFKGFNQEQLELLLNENPDVVPPTSEAISKFLELFDLELNKNQKLRKLEIEETYKEKIFDIYGEVLETKEMVSQISRKIENSAVQSNINRDQLLESYKDSLDSIEMLVRDLEADRAIAELAALKSRLESHSIDDAEVLAKLSFLQAEANWLVRNTEEQNKAYIAAYLISPSKKKYAERAVTTYAKIGDYSASEKLQEELLKIEPFNARAWYVKYKYVNNSDPLFYQQIPEMVKNDPDFKEFVLLDILSDTEKDWLSHSLDFYEAELTDIVLPEKIDRTNLVKWSAILQIKYNQFLKAHNVQHSLRINHSLKDNPLLIELNEICNLFDSSINESNSKVRHQNIKHLGLHVKYLLEPTTENALLFYFEYRKDGKLDYVFYSNLLMALSQTGEYDKVIEMLDEDSSIDPFLYTYGIAACVAQGDQAKVKIYSKKLIDSITKVDHHNLEQILQHLIFFKDQVNIGEFMDNFLERVEISEADKRLLELNVEALTETYENISLDEIEKLSNQVDEKDYVRKTNLASLYYFKEEYLKSNELLEPFIDFQYASPAMIKYALNLYYSKTDTTKLLELLELIRSQEPPSPKLLGIEIELCGSIPDWEKVKVVAKLGVDHFPEILQFHVNYLVALRHLGEVEVLGREIKLIKSKKLDFESTRGIVQLCLGVKDYETALELIYPFTNEKDNIVARESFAIMIATVFPNDFFKPIYEVDINCYVYYDIDEQEKEILINESTISNNQIASSIYKKGIGDVVKLKSGKTIKINRIFRKEEVRFKEIWEEIDQRKDEGYVSEVFHFDGTPEGFFKEIEEKIGLQEDERKIQIEELQNKYLQGEISFSVLAKSVYQENPLDAYSDLTSNSSRYFRIMPLSWFRNQRLYEPSKLLVDFSTLPLLFNLSKNHEVTFLDKFNVSAYVFEIIDQVIHDEQLSKSSPARLIFRGGKAVPLLLPENYQDVRLEQLIEFKAWCKSNCIVRTTSQKLDAIRGFQSSHGELDVITKHAVDNLALTFYEDLQLVTDDNHYTKHKSSFNIVSSEFYLMQQFPEDYTQKIFPILIESGYLGLRITDEILVQEFEKEVIEKKSFFRCLESLPVIYSQYQNTIPMAIKFLRHIYMNSELSLAERNRIASLVMTKALNEIEDSDHTRSLILGTCNVLFEFLPEQKANLLRVIDNVFKLNQ